MFLKYKLMKQILFFTVVCLSFIQCIADAQTKIVAPGELNKMALYFKKMTK